MKFDTGPLSIPFLLVTLTSLRYVAADLATCLMNYIPPTGQGLEYVLYGQVYHTRPTAFDGQNPIAITDRNIAMAPALYKGNFSAFSISTNIVSSAGTDIVQGGLFGDPITLSNFSMTIDAWLRVPQSGYYTFIIQSDYGAVMTIANDTSSLCNANPYTNSGPDVFVINNVAKPTGQVYLYAGFPYEVSITYVHPTGDPLLTVAAITPSGGYAADIGRYLSQLDVWSTPQYTLNYALVTKTNATGWSGTTTSLISVASTATTGIDGTLTVTTTYYIATPTVTLSSRASSTSTSTSSTSTELSTSISSETSIAIESSSTSSSVVVSSSLVVESVNSSSIISSSTVFTSVSSLESSSTVSNVTSSYSSESPSTLGVNSTVLTPPLESVPSAVSSIVSEVASGSSLSYSSDSLPETLSNATYSNRIRSISSILSSPSASSEVIPISNKVPGTNNSSLVSSSFPTTWSSESAAVTTPSFQFPNSSVPVYNSGQPRLAPSFADSSYTSSTTESGATLESSVNSVDIAPELASRETSGTFSSIESSVQSVGEVSGSTASNAQADIPPVTVFSSTLTSVTLPGVVSDLALSTAYANLESGSEPEGTLPQLITVTEVGTTHVLLITECAVCESGKGTLPLPAVTGNTAVAAIEALTVVPQPTINENGEATAVPIPGAPPASSSFAIQDAGNLAPGSTSYKLEKSVVLVLLSLFFIA